VTASDQVGEHADVGDEDDEEDPQRLAPSSTGPLLRKTVEHDADRDPDPEEQNRELEDRQQRVPRTCRW